MHVSRYAGCRADIWMNRGICWGLEASIGTFLIQITRLTMVQNSRILNSDTIGTSSPNNILVCFVLCLLWSLQTLKSAIRLIILGSSQVGIVVHTWVLDVMKIYNSMQWLSSISWLMGHHNNVCDITPWMLWMSINLLKSTAGASRMLYVAQNTQFS